MFGFSPELQEGIAAHGLRVLFIVFAGLVGYRLLRRVLDRVFAAVSGGLDGRRATLSSIVAVVLRIVFAVVFGILVLAEFGFSLGPLLASLGILGLAFSFGTQSLVRDLVSGFFLLFEDLCRVGEDVEVGGKRGRVERLQLRTLVIRDEKGATVFLPYGEIKALVNHSRSKKAPKRKS